MTDRAVSSGFAFPAYNIHDIFTLNAAVEGFAEAESDGIVQIYPDAAAAVSGSLRDPVLGAVTLAEHAKRLAQRCGVFIAVHTDHCDRMLAASYLEPLIMESRRRKQAGGENLFTGHMFDGSAMPLARNLACAKEYAQRCAEEKLWLEIEVGIMGSENRETAAGAKVYTSPEDFIAIYDLLPESRKGGLLVAPSFGNVHGVYKPGEVRLKPEILGICQARIEELHGKEARFELVFHGGSGSSEAEIREAISHGVVKMNFDTDGQYAFTRAVADYLFKNYDKVLRIDGEMGVKSAFFAETWLDKGKAALKAHVAAACRLLGSAGKSIRS
ncbi:MAG: class II fructose-bisphosphate aldolase, partial [Spirochaetales bacterium]